ncbi:BBE domain-containing protein [Ornithinibacillus sp. FSL M8-0202]
MYVGELNLKTEQEIIQPLLELATPLTDNTEITLYRDMHCKFDSYIREGFTFEGISLFFNELHPNVIQLLMDEVNNSELLVVIHLVELHGKVNQIPHQETAFYIRDASYLVVIEAEISSDPSKTQTWFDNLYEKLLPYSYHQISYLNSSQVNEEVIRNTYRTIADKLVVLKKEYDPNNLFCSEHNLID